MKALTFITGNAVKFRLATHVLAPFDISLTQLSLDIPEIQAEEGEPIARDKAAKAFAEIGKPLVVTDDTWLIPGLNNFPGPYMKSMNNWLTAEDWLRLTLPLQDRRIIIQQVLVYQDTDGQQLFTSDTTGTLLDEIRGTESYPHARISSFDGGKNSMAELLEAGKSALHAHRNVWHDLGEWLEKRS